MKDAFHWDERKRLQDGCKAGVGSLPSPQGVKPIRNLFYFGHGDRQRLALEDPSRSIDRDQLRKDWGNDPDRGRNPHAFRFVWLYQCESASKDLCKAFGIPRKQMSADDFLARGMRPRAFLGWRWKKSTGVQNVFSQQHQLWVQNVFTIWPTTYPNSQDRYQLRDALDAAAMGAQEPFTSLNEEVRLYGSPQLLFKDF